MKMAEVQESGYGASDRRKVRMSAARLECRQGFHIASQISATVRFAYAIGNT
jgi:hypothetical protein